jgi:hypothetical protein
MRRTAMLMNGSTQRVHDAVGHFLNAYVTGL